MGVNRNTSYDALEFKAEPHEALRSRAWEWIEPLLKYDWKIKSYDKKELTFLWDLDSPQTRLKMFSFCTVARYLSEVPFAVLNWFEYRKFMSDDEAYLTCCHVKQAQYYNNGHLFCPGLDNLVMLKGWTFQHYIDNIDKGNGFDTIFYKLQQPPYFNRKIDKGFGGLSSILFTPELYKLLSEIQPITKENASLWLDAITRKAIPLKHEIIDFSTF